MSKPQTEGKGVLVVHDDGAATWMSQSTPAVASVMVGVGRGAVVEVDAADPSSVLGWSVQRGGDADALGKAFEDRQFVDRLRLLRETGAEVFVKSAPSLATTWVRRATVAAVDQCTVRPVSEEALWLDRAAADYGAGRVEQAASLFRTAAPVLLGLGRDCLAGDITGGAATDLAEIAGKAAFALHGSGWESDVSALARRLEAETGLNDDAISSALSDWSPAVLGEGVLSSAGDLSGDEHAVDGGYLDPSAVPPRLFLWLGADYRDVRVSTLSAPDRAVVSAYLSGASYVGSPEAEELIAYAADKRTETLVAVAPMRVDGRVVIATLTLDGRTPEELSYGIYHADTDPTELRLDALGQDLVKVDRFMLDAYNHHRMALAALHEQSATDDIDAMAAMSEEHLRYADTAATNASNMVEDLLFGDLDGDAAELLGRRKAAIDAYIAILATSAVAPLGTDPLLTELLPSTIDDLDG